MDFLIIVVMYVIVFSLSAFILLSADNNTQGVVGITRRQFIWLFEGVYYKLLPIRLQSWIAKTVHHIFNQRNCYLQITYCLITAACFWVYSLQILPLALDYGSSPFFAHGPFLELLLNLYFFISTALQDPGTISSDNINKFLKTYLYDGRIYIPEVTCRTCTFTKPARSKHCAICNRCVVRFDHHCSWVNNCIGAYNVKLFIGYLITMTLMCIHIVILGVYSLLNIVYSTRLHKAQYLDSEGKLRPVNFRVILQHLFLEQPLMVFITVTLALLWFLISGFTVYHLYLASINQTTNERYKMEALKRKCSEWQSNFNPRETNNKIKKARFKHFNVTAQKCRMKDKTKEYTTNIYDNGFFNNIKEILFAFD